eukprot:TRINITY_DN81960_c0_g3_i2.p1 TRINITY_DN81960_c0_g3~~TRINITY_DN81960_c0_g3_i2.p1  ORF type:complete len:327 (-),score=108.27 TRINITY_DN81960_c0_g3_i2:255-1235(-)
MPPKSAKKRSKKQQALKLFKKSQHGHLSIQEERALLEQAIELDSSNPNIVNTLVGIYFEMNELELGGKWLDRSIELDPTDPGKILYKANMSVEDEARDLFLRAVELLEARATEATGDTLLILKADIAKACVSLADLYMCPPMCDLPEAESFTEQYLMRALEAAPSSIDALQTCGRLRLYQGRREESVELMDRVLESLNSTEEELLPDPCFITQTAELFFQLEDFAKADQVLDICLSIHDSMPEPFVLSCRCLKELGDYEMAMERIRSAKLIIRAAKKQLRGQMDEEMTAIFADKLGEVNALETELKELIASGVESTTATDEDTTMA